MVQSFGQPVAGRSPVEQVDYSSGHICSASDCAAELILTEDAARLEVVIPQLDENHQVVYQPFISQATGTFAYEPYHFHEQCWQEYVDALVELLEEYDARTVHDEYSFITCTYCYSGIRLHEPMGLVRHGALHANKRTPNGEGSPSWYTRPGAVDYLCLACVRAINDEVITLWEENGGISYAGECPACTHARIWRRGELCNHPWPEPEDDEE
jgi:hypothetical protein